MANNMEFVSTYANPGRGGVPARGEQQASQAGQMSQVSEWRRNSWMLEMERALLAATEVTAAPEVPPSLLGGAAGVQTSPVQVAQGTVAGSLALTSVAARVASPEISPTTSQVASPLASKLASSANSVGQADTATLSDAASEGPAKTASALLKAPVQTLAGEGAGDGNLNGSSTGLNNDLGNINDLDNLGNQGNQGNLESAQAMAPWLNPYQIGQMSSMYFGAGSQAQLNEMGLNPALSALRTDAAGLSMLQSRLAVADREPGQASMNGTADVGADLTEGADGLVDDAADGTRFMARSTASTKAMQAAQDTYAKRQLHLYPGADGVQAWIRDVDLNEIQAQAVALALRQELNGSGLKLKTLTLNGRKLETPEGDPLMSFMSPPPPSMPVTQPDGKKPQ